MQRRSNGCNYYSIHVIVTYGALHFIQMMETVSSYQFANNTYELAKQTVYFVDTEVCFEHIYYDMIDSSLKYKEFALIGC